MRDEYKYLISKAHLAPLRAALMPYMLLDPHGKGFEGAGYTVRSIYLDTMKLRYYREKKAGIKVRRKLRIRAYNACHPDDWAFLEIKRKVEGKVSKNRAPVRLRDLPLLFETGDVARYVVRHPHYPQAETDARRFFYHLRRYRLQPTGITVYEREAFLGRFDPTLRITFDRDLRGHRYPDLLQLHEEAGVLPVFPDYFILEVKFNTRFPAWLRPILGQYDLRNRALSKYCMCVDIGRENRLHPFTVLPQARPLAPTC